MKEEGGEERRRRRGKARLIGREGGGQEMITVIRKSMQV